MKPCPALIPALAVLALSSACAMAEPPRQAWTPPAGDPPVLEENASAARIDAWKAQHLRTGDYAEATTDANRVTLYLPGSIRNTGQDRIEAVFRSELFRPRFADGHWLRSIRKTMEIDCAALRYRELELHGFSGSNMTAPVPPITPPTKWIGPFTAESSAGSGLKQACDHASAKP